MLSHMIFHESNLIYTRIATFRQHLRTLCCQNCRNGAQPQITSEVKTPYFDQSKVNHTLKSGSHVRKLKSPNSIKLDTKLDETHVINHGHILLLKSQITHFTNVAKSGQKWSKVVNNRLKVT